MGKSCTASGSRQRTSGRGGLCRRRSYFVCIEIAQIIFGETRVLNRLHNDLHVCCAVCCDTRFHAPGHVVCLTFAATQNWGKWHSCNLAQRCVCCSRGSIYTASAVPATAIRRCCFIFFYCLFVSVFDCIFLVKSIEFHHFTVCTVLMRMGGRHSLRTMLISSCNVWMWSWIW